MRQLENEMPRPLAGHGAVRLNPERQLRRVSAQLITAHEVERQRVARALHDRVGHLLTAIKLDAERVAGLLSRTGTDEARELAARIAGRARAAAEEIRRVQHDLHPAALDDLGISAILTWFCEELSKRDPPLSVTCELTVDDGAVPVLLKTAIFRIVQEMLLSVSGPRAPVSAWVRLSRVQERIEIAISDDGSRLSLKELAGDTPVAVAITRIRGRVELSGGCFELKSTAGRLTSLRVTWTAPGAHGTPA